MAQQFEFILPNEKRKLYNRFALLLFILNTVAVIIKATYSWQDPERNPTLLLSAAALLLLVYLNFVAYTDKVTRYTKAFIGATIAVSLYWFYLGPWWVGALCLLLTVFYVVAQRELKVTINETCICYPSFPKNNIKWDELNNMVLKDGLLTIDFKNDKIIQQYPELKMNPVNEQEFNEFCRQRLEA